jgi:hypothetical protein
MQLGEFILFFQVGLLTSSCTHTTHANLYTPSTWLPLVVTRTWLILVTFIGCQEWDLNPHLHMWQVLNHFPTTWHGDKSCNCINVNTMFSQFWTLKCYNVI